MTSLFSVLFLLVGIALTLAAIMLAVRRGWRQLAVANAYRDVARQLGLLVDTRGVSLHGYLGERRLWIGEVMTGHGPDRALITWGILDFSHPLGLGLLIRRRDLSHRLFRRSHSPGLPFGDEELDRSFELSCDEAPNARPLLDDHQVRSAFHTLISQWPKVVITDRGVRVHISQPEARPERLSALVQAMLTLCEAVEQARLACPTPTRLAGHSRAWAAIAAGLELEAIPSLPGAWGAMQGRRLRLQTVREQSGYRQELMLWFRPHDLTGLRLTPQERAADAPSIGQDIQVGEAEFDARFVIKGFDPMRIAKLLNPALRVDLLALSRAGRLDLDEDRIWLRDLDLRPEELPPLAHKLRAIADHLGW